MRGGRNFARPWRPFLAPIELVMCSYGDEGSSRPSPCTDCIDQRGGTVTSDLGASIAIPPGALESEEHIEIRAGSPGLWIPKTPSAYYPLGS